jgi:hypothetical protein
MPGNPVPPVITLLSRPGCHLCDQAREVIARVAADLGVPWEERDVTQSQDDLRAYGETIPVTLINGVQHDFWHVSERRLRTARAAAGARGPPAPRGAAPAPAPAARPGSPARSRRAREPPTLCKRSQGRTVM